MAADIIAILRQRLHPAGHVKEILIPVARFILCPRRFHGGGDILDVVALPATGQTRHFFGPERRNDTGRAPAPVIPAKDRAGDIQRLHQVFQIMADGGLLP